MISEWPQVTLNDLTTRITYGFTNPMPTTDAGPVMVTARDIRDGRIDYETARHTDLSAYRDLLTDKSRPNVGDVLLTKDGSIGRVAVCDRSDVCINQSVALLQLNDRVDSHYLAYLLRSPKYQDLLEQGAQGSTIKHIYISRVGELALPLPPLPEQRAIAEVLGALDDKIAANTALAYAAEQLLRTEIDAEWLSRDDRSSTLADFVELNPKVTVPRTQSAIYIDMKRLPESGWSIDGFDYREPKGGARFQNGDTLLARITPCLENRKTGYVDHLDSDEVGVGSTEFIVFRSRDMMAPPISFLLATAPRFREYAVQHMIGTSGRQRVAASDLAAFEMPTPDHSWLVEFGTRATTLFTAVAAHDAENRTLAATRDALLPQLMSGKLRVRDAEEAASRAGA
ncbi:MAG: restriction endonuclease subunit S [Microbacterium sp.]|uniref:restriction endonuclease subunit S n=1 Tax=Microbacterium sp. TaxID=51671 RepID=UPI003F816FB4